VRRLKDAGRQSVWLIQRPGEQPRTLKSWPLTPLLLVKLALGIAQPQRQLRGARRVARAGIPTAEVCCLKLAWGRPRPAGPRKLRGHGRPQVEIELGWVEGSSAYDLVSSGSLSPSDRRRTSAAVGRVVAKLVEAGLFNRDLKLSNLIVDFSAGRADVWLIDTVGIRRLRAARRAARPGRHRPHPAGVDAGDAPCAWGSRGGDAESSRSAAASTSATGIRVIAQAGTLPILPG
jgi:hypothetical protein